MHARLIPADQIGSRLLGAWRELVDEASEPNPFHQPECVVPALRWLPGGTDVQLATVWSADRLLFLLPVQGVRSYRRIPLRTLRWWRHPYAFLSTPLLSKAADPVEIWARALQGVADADRTALLALELFPTDGAVAHALQDAARHWGKLTLVESSERPTLSRRQEPTYLDGRLSKQRRKNLRRYERRMEEQLGGKLAHVNEAEKDDESFTLAVDGFLDQEASGWKGRDGGALACQPDHAEFFREVAARFRRTDQLELWSLGTEKTKAAYQCNIKAGDTIFHFKVSYDESFASWSPGLQLEVRMVSEFHADRSLNRIDSCAEAGTVVSEMLYADRRTISSALVPVRGGVARLVATSAPEMARAYRSVKRSVKATGAADGPPWRTVRPLRRRTQRQP